MKRQGFTVLQAIVILAIVTVLAAIIFPLFARGRGSHRNSCQSHLKQMALGFIQYIHDYDKKYPIAKNNSLGATYPENWTWQITPYIKSGAVFQCPQDASATDEKKSSYGYNSRMSRLNNSKVKNPAHIILNFEVVADPDNWTQTGSTPTAVTASTRHLEGSNFSFMDGHIKWFKPGKVGTSTNGAPTFTPY